MKTIRALRQEQGWTQFELAMRVGVQPQAVYLWESGQRLPQVPQMRRLGEVFGLCSDDIVLESIERLARGGRPRPRADRATGEPSPGRDKEGRPLARPRVDPDPPDEP